VGIVSEHSGDEVTASAPALRVVRGEPSPEEVAVLTALVAAAGSGGGEGAAAPICGQWNDPVHSVRKYWRQGEGGWRTAR
jgi:Acyl-CoA carboxylase epsilon subunit